jgi:hypothetical protein
VRSVELAAYVRESGSRGGIAPPATNFSRKSR